MWMILLISLEDSWFLIFISVSDLTIGSSSASFAFYTNLAYTNLPILLVFPTTLHILLCNFRGVVKKIIQTSATSSILKLQRKENKITEK